LVGIKPTPLWKLIKQLDFDFCLQINWLTFIKIDRISNIWLELSKIWNRFEKNPTPWSALERSDTSAHTKVTSFNYHLTYSNLRNSSAKGTWTKKTFSISQKVLRVIYCCKYLHVQFHRERKIYEFFMSKEAQKVYFFYWKFCVLLCQFEIFYVFSTRVDGIKMESIGIEDCGLIYVSSVDLQGKVLDLLCNRMIERFWVRHCWIEM